MLIYNANLLLLTHLIHIQKLRFLYAVILIELKIILLMHLAHCWKIEKFRLILKYIMFEDRLLLLMSYPIAYPYSLFCYT